MTYIRLITDSVADLPQDIIQQFNIHVVPVHVTLGAQSYLDNGSLDRECFYQALTQKSTFPTTAAPAPYEFLKAYRQLADEGAEDIIGLFTASKVSSIYAHAQIAAQDFKRARVHLIDTEQISMGIGLLVQLAAEARSQGATGIDVVALLSAAKAHTRVLGVLNSVQHLQHSGRVSWAAAQFVELLQIKPLIEFVGGDAKLLGRVRTYHRAVDRLFTLAASLAPFERVAVIHSRPATQWITHLQQSLQPLTKQTDAIRSIEVGPIFGTHVGAQCLGIALIQATHT